MAARLSTEGLRYARAVAETGSFSAAARAQAVSQPALSNSIAKLEERLGERLFERSTRGVTPTPFGEQILPLVDKALISVDAISAEAARWTASGDEVIRMGVSPLIDSRLVAATYDAVCCLSALPGPRRLVLREANMTELRDALLVGDLDLILIPSVGPLPRYEHRIIASEPMVVVEPRTADTAPMNLDDLHGKQLILMPDTCGLTTFTHELTRTHDLKVRPYAGEASSYRVLEEWANMGLGSALVPRSKLSSADTHHRPLCLDGQEVAIFYEAVWDPNSPLASDMEILASRLAARS
ncbi:MAG TPA: LysR family transcriptional regulator [Nocardioidaceae bacterium]|nr:LysR family transcriptional regulator [Nocardioidaceae bacterium]